MTTQETGVHKASLEIREVLVASIAHLQPREAQAQSKSDHYRRGGVGGLLCIGDAREVGGGVRTFSGDELGREV